MIQRIKRRTKQRHSARSPRPFDPAEMTALLKSVYLPRFARYIRQRVRIEDRLSNLLVQHG